MLTPADMERVLENVDRRLTAIESKLSDVDGKVTAIESKVDEQGVMLLQILARLPEPAQS